MILESCPSREFPDAVSECLESLHLEFSGEKTLTECLPLVKKVDQYYGPKEFGRFNLTLVNNEIFKVFVIFMDNNSTNIHDHPFTGCFTPLIGSPFEVTYSFKEEQELSPRMTSGHLTMERITKVNPGEVRKIKNGFIHQLLRSVGGQFSLVVSKLPPVSERENFFYLYPNLKIKNSLDSSFVRRLITAFDAFDLQNAQAKELFNSLSFDEVLEFYLFSGIQQAKENSGDEALAMMRFFAKEYLQHTSCWETLQAHENFSRNLWNKISIL